MLRAVTLVAAIAAAAVAAGAAPAAPTVGDFGCYLVGGPDPLKLLDSFKCYSATAETFRQRRIVVTDRIRGKARVTVRRPTLLCNPTTERFGKTHTKVRNATGRLVCYETQPAAIKPQTQLA